MEFVNWDHTEPALSDYPLDMDLALENAIEDDFSFTALEHYMGTIGDFDSTTLPHDSELGGYSRELHDHTATTVDAAGSLRLPEAFSTDTTTTTAPDWLGERAPVDCSNCAASRYQCKLIYEGQFKGYCTSCVALGLQCNFAGLSSQRLPTPSHPNPTSSPAIGPITSLADLWPNRTANTASTENLADLLSTSASMDHSNGNAGAAAPLHQLSSANTPQLAGLGKIGARLSRESIRILKQWLSTHTRHPYPSDEEKDMLQRQTGLTRTQITNWLANARRRGKIQPPRSTSPHPQGAWAGPIDIPPRRGTPALETKNPLQRWVDSPPENEPASPIAIARAVTASSAAASSGQASPFSHIYTDDGSSRSVHGSSASSVGTTSQGSSGGSFASAFSYASRGSLTSFGSLNRGRRRRRRRNATKRPEEKTTLSVPVQTYQCTFCTSCFKTKHDWQRHEKSLHLSLERWVCCANGPRAVSPETNTLACAFCGLANPDDAHIESHNYSACNDKALTERTFYRKDHLNQHLRLVHDVKFADWSMKSWRVATPQIRSRCGFCGIVMDTWSIRVDHLAEHFKTGYSMADWKGGWGFDPPVLDLVENSIPPYLIHMERSTPFPFAASDSPPESPRNAYELIKLELAFYMYNREGKEEPSPTEEQLQVEACRIIFASEVLSLQGISSMQSWLRDLIMSSPELSQQAQFGPLRGQAENRLSVLKINGKDNLFEACPLEENLQQFVRNKRLLGLTAMDDELQEEACTIVGQMEEISTFPSDSVANWLVKLIKSSTSWLSNFRQRAHLPRTEDVADARLRSTDPRTIDSTIHNYSRLERELSEFMERQQSLGIEPTDEDLQRQARIVIYEYDDGWNQTAADNKVWLAGFRARHSQRPGLRQAADHQNQVTHANRSDSDRVSGGAHAADGQNGFLRAGTCPVEARARQGLPSKLSPFFLNDANCYRRLATELKRFVISTMSPKNPNQHVPSDEELQHHARYILYDDDDPWNQTAADNAEWLQRFKRDVGIITGGPGLPINDSWSVQQGGSGFAPPYAFPGENLAHYIRSLESSTVVGATPFDADPSVTNRFLKTLTERHHRPARIFCSRELEDGLLRFTQAEVARWGAIPPNEVLQQKAKEILGTQTTAADDLVLLSKFRDMVEKEASNGLGTTPLLPVPGNNTVTLDSNFSGLGLDSQAEDLLQTTIFDLDSEDFLNTMDIHEGR